MKKFILVFTIISTLILFSGCFQEKNVDKISKDNSIPVSSITILSSNPTEIWDVHSEPILFKVLPENATNKTIIWTSSNPKVATVSIENGNVVLRGVRGASGDSTITATSADRKVTTSVSVIVTTYVPLQEISFTSSSLSLSVNENKTLDVFYTPQTASIKTVYWTSSDNSIVTVSSLGQVTGIKPGVCTISAIATDGDGSIKAECKVTVLSQTL